MRDIVNTSDNIKTSNMDVSNTNLISKEKAKTGKSATDKTIVKYTCFLVINFLITFITYNCHTSQFNTLFDAIDIK